MISKNGRSRFTRISEFMACMLLAGFTVVLGGCGDGRPDCVPVAGRILIDGQPLKRGVIRFVPTGGRPATSMIGRDGRFSLSTFEKNDGAIFGVHRVEVTANELIGETSIHWHAPKKYSNHKTSGLVRDVNGPIDNLVIELSWGGGRPFDEPQ